MQNLISHERLHIIDSLITAHENDIDRMSPTQQDEFDDSRKALEQLLIFAKESGRFGQIRTEYNEIGLYGLFPQKLELLRAIVDFYQSQVDDAVYRKLFDKPLVEMTGHEVGVLFRKLSATMPRPMAA